MSDQELEKLGQLNPGWSFERDDGSILMSPTHSEGGAHSAEALIQLAYWRGRTAAGVNLRLENGACKNRMLTQSRGALGGRDQSGDAGCRRIG
jgi:hypothetical protein